MSSSEFKVLIIGGGSCGLTLAQGLRKAGIPYTLYERDSKDDYHNRPRDWGSLLHWGQEYMQRCVPADIWARRSEMYVDPFDDYESHSGCLIWNGKTGEEIKQLASTKGVVRVSRRKIRMLLSEGLAIEYSKKLVNISTGGLHVTAFFEDGTSATGSLLVGCDGGRSRTRDQVVGSEAGKGFDTDYTMINTWTTVSADTAIALRAKHPIISQAQHPDGFPGLLIATLDIPSKDALPDTWKFQIYTGWRGAPRKADLQNNDKAIQFFKEIFKHHSEPFLSVGEVFSEKNTLPVDDGWNFKPLGDFKWDNHHGMVTLAGDAAHSMLPHRRQGLNNAIMDSAGLLHAITKVVRGEQGLEDAIGAYEDEMRPRGAQEVELTYQQMLAASARDWKDTPMYKIGLDRVEKF